MIAGLRGHGWSQCTFVSVSQTAYTCSSAVPQLVIRLSWGHQGMLELHSAYFIAEGMKAYKSIRFSQKSITISIVCEVHIGKNGRFRGSSGLNLVLVESLPSY